MFVWDFLNSGWMELIVVVVFAAVGLWCLQDGLSSIIDHYACKDPNFPLTPPPDSNYLPQGWPYGATGSQQTGQGEENRGDTHV